MDINNVATLGIRNNVATLGIRNNVATLGIRIEMPGAEQVAPGLDRITAAGARTEQAFRQTMASAQDFARAGASAAQVAQLTGASIADARQAVQIYGDTMARTTQETIGLRAAQEEMAIAGMGKATEAFNLSGVGLGRIRQGLVSLVAQSTGTIPVIDRMGAALLGGFGIGGGTMIAVLAGLAAIAFAWDKITESSRKAKEEQDAAIKAAEDFSRKKAEGPGGKIGVGTDAEVQRAADDLIKISQLQARLDAHPSYSRTKVNEIKAEIQDLRTEWSGIVTVIQDGTAEVARLTAEADANDREQRERDLEERVRFNSKDVVARAALHAALIEEEAKYVRDLKSGTSAEIAADATRIQAIKDTFDPKKQTTAADAYAKATQAIRDHAAALRSENDALQSGESSRVTYSADLAYRVGLEQAQVEHDPALRSARIAALTDEHAAAVAVDQTNKALRDKADALRWAQDASAAAAKKAEEDAKRQEEAAERLFLQPFESAIRGVEQANSNFFENLFKPHTNAVQEFWMDFKNIAIKTFADILSLNFMEQLLGADSKAGLARSFASMLGMGGGSGSTGETTTGGLSNGNILMSVLGPMLASGGLGYGAGYSTSNSAVGLLAGAGAGALSGSALGPYGALAGGVIGLIGGIFGSQKRHSDDAADALAKLAKETNKVAQSFSGLPDGFKIAYDEFLATTGRGGYSYGGDGPSGGGAGGPGIQVQGHGGTVFNVSGNITINGANVKDLQSLAKAVQAGARASLNRGGPGLTLAMAP